MKVAEDIFTYSPYCCLDKWIGLCGKTGLSGSVFPCELFGEWGVGKNEGDHWFVHSFVCSFIDPFNKHLKHKSHSPQSVTQRKPETLGSTPRTKFGQFIWHNFPYEFPERVREELVSLGLSSLKWTMEAQAFFRVFISLEAPGTPPEALLRSGIQSLMRLSMCDCKVSRKTYSREGSIWMRGQWIRLCPPRIQEPCKKK